MKQEDKKFKKQYIAINNNDEHLKIDEQERIQIKQVKETIIWEQ